MREVMEGPRQRVPGREGKEGLRSLSFHSLLLGLLGLVFVGLFLGLGLVNSQRLEKALFEAELTKAVSTRDAVERNAEGIYRLLLGAEGRREWPEAGSFMGSESLSLDDLLLTPLVDLAVELDAAEDEGRISSERLEEILRDSNILHALFMDSSGRIILKDSSFPDELLRTAKELLNADGTIFTRLFSPSPDPGLPGFIAIRRRRAPGIVLIAFGQKELESWRLRASLQEALETVEGRMGVLYLEVRDGRGRALAQAGEVRGDKDRAPPVTRLSMGDMVLLERHLVGRGPVLEARMPLHVGRDLLLLAAGLDGTESGELMRRNRLQIYLTTAMMTSMAFMAVFLLYLTQRRQQARLDEVRERLRQAERFSALGRLAGMVAHEVRNPLNAISMAVQRLGREYAPQGEEGREEFSKLVGLIREEIRRINGIVEDFLGVTRKGKLELREIPIGDLLEKLKTLVEAQASSRNVEIVVADRGSGPVVLADGERIMQALLNLVNNSLEAMPPRGGVISLSSWAEGKDRAVIEVSDTGKGIPPEEMDKIFDLGFTTKARGLGLGLHVAREIVELHGGEIKVRQREGGGIVFSVYLPAKGETQQRRQS